MHFMSLVLCIGLQVVLGQNTNGQNTAIAGLSFPAQNGQNTDQSGAIANTLNNLPSSFSTIPNNQNNVNGVQTTGGVLNQSGQTAMQPMVTGQAQMIPGQTPMIPGQTPMIPGQTPMIPGQTGIATQNTFQTGIPGRNPMQQAIPGQTGMMQGQQFMGTQAFQNPALQNRFTAQNGFIGQTGFPGVNGQIQNGLPGMVPNMMNPGQPVQTQPGFPGQQVFPGQTGFNQPAGIPGVPGQPVFQGGPFGITPRGCHQSGCANGQQCVYTPQTFGQPQFNEYMCPNWIPVLPCQCRQGCRAQNQFIPFGQSRQIDQCGNVCSCNSQTGQAACTMRACPNTINSTAGKKK